MLMWRRRKGFVAWEVVDPRVRQYQISPIISLPSGLEPTDQALENSLPLNRIHPRLRGSIM